MKYVDRRRFLKTTAAGAAAGALAMIGSGNNLVTASEKSRIDSLFGRFANIMEMIENEIHH